MSMRGRSTQKRESSTAIFAASLLSAILARTSLWSLLRVMCLTLPTTTFL